MTRGLTDDALAAIGAEVAYRCVAVELTFDSAPVRLCSAPFDVSIGGNAYLGVGELGSIAAIEEASDVQAATLSLALMGIPRDAIDVALAEPYQGRSAVIFEVPMTSDFVPVASPVVMFRGHMDVMTIVLGDTAAVQISVVNRLADWERPKINRFSNEDQQRLHPGDRGMEFAAAMESKDIVWPSAAWFQKHT